MVLSFAILASVVVVGTMALLISTAVRRRSHPFPSCGRCGYDVSGSIGQVERCPECGASFTLVGIRAPGRLPMTRRGMLALAIALLVGLGGMTVAMLGLRQAAATEARAAQRAMMIQQQMAQQAPVQQPGSTDPESPGQVPD